MDTVPLVCRALDWEPPNSVMSSTLLPRAIRIGKPRLRAFGIVSSCLLRVDLPAVIAIATRSLARRVSENRPFKPLLT